MKKRLKNESLDDKIQLLTRRVVLLLLLCRITENG